jgi:hypothetical protein
MKKHCLIGLFILFILVLAFSACSKKIPLPQDKLNYSGVWISETLDTLVIRADGSADCKVSNTSVSGGVIKFEGTTLIIEQFGIGPKMKIIKAPTQVENIWEMTLDGIKFVKK